MPPLTAKSASPRNLLSLDYAYYDSEGNLQWDWTNLLCLDKSVASRTLPYLPAASYAALGKHEVTNTVQNQVIPFQTARDRIGYADSAFRGLQSWGSGVCYDTAGNAYRLPAVSEMGFGWSSSIQGSTWQNALSAVGGVALWLPNPVPSFRYVKQAMSVSAVLKISRPTLMMYDGTWMSGGYNFHDLSGQPGISTDGGPWLYYAIRENLMSPAQVMATADPGSDGRVSIYAAAQADWAYAEGNVINTSFVCHTLDYFNIDRAFTIMSGSPGIYDTFSDGRWKVSRVARTHSLAISSGAAERIIRRNNTLPSPGAWLYCWLVYPMIYHSGQNPSWYQNFKYTAAVMIEGVDVTLTWK